MKATEDTIVDWYNFEIPITVAENNSRIACDKRCQERQVKWDTWAQKGALPSGATLKRALRKVST
jgi:hypothetical protein